ncbi:MAG: PQQ-dependent sugar dehydrogenase, partial [Chloroflexota bacterium]|nr:PQQ-dependent sugar dehydrogenase [Chloroflexota bacterium]
DGSSLLIHAKADDLESQPSGDSGGRIACGVVAAPTEEAMPASPIASAAAVSVENDVVNPEQIPFSEDMLGQLDVPEGFEISVYSQGLDNPRMMAFGPDGTLYVTEPAANSVVGLRDTDGDGQVDETIPAASNLPLVHGILFHEGRVFLAGEKQVWSAEVADDGTFGNPDTILDNLPDGGQHPRRTIAIGPDGMLYTSLGSSCNSCVEPNPEAATIIRPALDGSGREIFAKGLRNTLGFQWNPETDALWGWDQGSDWRGGDQPPEELNQIVEGGNYGWPHCFGDQEPDIYQSYVPSGATSEQYCANTQAPTMIYQAHSSPITFLFYTADQFPAEYQGDGFVAMRGSWNRDPVTGYELVHVDFENGEPVSAEPFISGWLVQDGAGHFGRIAGLVVTPEGSLLISDDTNGVIYEVSYIG